MEHVRGMELKDLKGIGPKTEKLFEKLGVHTPGDLLYYFPNAYISFAPPVPIGTLEEGQTAAVRGLLEKDATIVNLHGRCIVTAYVRELTGKLKLVWFNAPFLRKQLKAGSILVFTGKVTRNQQGLCMTQPRFYTPEDYEKKTGTLEPVYAQTRGLSNALIRKAVEQAFEVCPLRPDFVPPSVLYNRKLPSMEDAVRRMHFPDSEEDFRRARSRLAYNELFLFSLALSVKKQNAEDLKSRFRVPEDKRTDAFIRELPFKLTAGQSKAAEEIRKDMRSGYVMNRLLQGDVGSGKTIIAVIAILETAAAGFESALMAPTEILAAQHYAKIVKLLEKYRFPYRAVLVTGSMKAGERQEIYDQIRNHEADIIVGTHALFQEKITYDKLALVITDEQHRFGVNQRKELSGKGERPHVLVMSATPIPRTLSMLLYADMQVSRITELPADRLPIRNAVVDENYRPNAYRFILDEIRKGRQAYVICPMVEANDTLELENVTDYTEKLRGIFPDGIRIACLHGKLKPREKDEIMERFLQKEIDILVSTTVVEVGVDVPNATVMLVENAERFGLAQLHQLRGRVGRSAQQSYCIFVDTQHSKLSQERLKILAGSNDGFRIAEEDLRLRGPGDIFGIRQSGALDFTIADIYEDRELLRQSAEDAGFILHSDRDLSLPENTELRKRLDEYLTESYTL